MIRGIALAALASVSMFGLSGEAQAQYPERPIQMIVPWAAGGGTDATGRIIATGLEEVLGVPVNVVNRTGGSGVVGHTAIASAPADGYTIGVVTIEIGMMHWQGLTDLTYENYDFLAQTNQDAASVMVSTDSEYETAADLLAAIKESEPGTFKASGTGQGGIWHLGLIGWMMSEDLPPDQVAWVPSDGAAPGLQNMVAGGVDVVTAALPEGRSLIEAERVRPLANMDTKRLELFPEVPTLKEATGSDWVLNVWRTIAAPKGLPPEVKEKLASALKTVYDGAQYQDFMASRGFGTIFRGPEETTEFVAAADKQLGETMRAGGLAQ
ncbi:tripartite tricarboxylate transporter substrate binding protein [Marinivivus vitaminiproducens]|uniref:tripartite tricarboxylate transporter substrate binding protein n=1 Tax=Marinivivus vitaminiproducens TaxID=3035935 RepID=UPI00279CAB54|nr:tripartite tricarboxylate transporter substrate binding protein [Geminicoccaceae bacterium SCSIO 64248]